MSKSLLSVKSENRTFGTAAALFAAAAGFVGFIHSNPEVVQHPLSELTSQRSTMTCTGGEAVPAFVVISAGVVTETFVVTA